MSRLPDSLLQCTTIRSVTLCLKYYTIIDRLMVLSIYIPPTSPIRKPACGGTRQKKCQHRIIQHTYCCIKFQSCMFGKFLTS